MALDKLPLSHDGRNHRDAAASPIERVPPVASTRIAMIALITTELMLFAGMIGMYLVIRLAPQTWPPPGQPRLPLLMTAINSLVLFASLVPVTSALRAIRAGDGARAARALGLTTALGVVFLAVQGARVDPSRAARPHARQQPVRRRVLPPDRLPRGSTSLTAVAVARRRDGLAHRGRWTRRRATPAWRCARSTGTSSAALWAVLFPLVYLY